MSRLDDLMLSPRTGAVLRWIAVLCNGVAVGVELYGGFYLLAACALVSLAVVWFAPAIAAIVVKRITRRRGP